MWKIDNRCDFILDTETGIFYYGSDDASKHYKGNFKRHTITSYVSGNRTNKTSLVRV